MIVSIYNLIRPVDPISDSNTLRDVSVSEFFLKNRLVFGLDTPAKASVAAMRKEADKALGACRTKSTAMH